GCAPAPGAAPGEGAGQPVGLASRDATTGELCATGLPITAVLDELVRVAPREVLAAPGLLADPERGPLAQIRARYRVAWNAAEIPDDAAARRELGAIAPAGESGESGEGGDSAGGGRGARAHRDPAAGVASARPARP